MAVLDELEPMPSSQKLNPLQRSGVILAHVALPFADEARCVALMES